ncbi:MAG: type II toxin-antitoxin system VapC family toxin [Melioribacteraceae bacterium]|nr:type II toxin-antitoxin system VapC family toxin [Melioribacteraceae bacterium]
MNYLFDTHTLLWSVGDTTKLSENVKQLYLNSNNNIFFSIVSIWELAIKIRLQKLNLNVPLQNFVDEHILGNNIQILDLKLNHLFKLEKLPLHHRDPFDRIIISQAFVENLPIVGIDKTFDNYQIKRIW